MKACFALYRQKMGPPHHKLLEAENGSYGSYFHNTEMLPGRQLINTC